MPEDEVPERPRAQPGAEEIEGRRRCDRQQGSHRRSRAILKLSVWRGRLQPA